MRDQRSKSIKEPLQVVEWLENRATRLDNGCLLCHMARGAVNRYPATTVNGWFWDVHRLVFTVRKGKIPEGLFVTHSCDNKRCIEIEHLILGNASTNGKDAVRNRKWANQYRAPS